MGNSGDHISSAGIGSLLWLVLFYFERNEVRGFGGCGSASGAPRRDERVQAQPGYREPLGSSREGGNRNCALYSQESSFPPSGPLLPSPVTRTREKMGRLSGAGYVQIPTLGGCLLFFPTQTLMRIFGVARGLGGFYSVPYLNPDPILPLSPRPFVLTYGGGGGRKLHKITPSPLTTESLIFSLP